MKSFLLKVARGSWKAGLMLFKIMIPVTIAVKILQETGLIPYLGDLLYPMMKLTGLPGEMGIVWATAIIANIYGGLLAFVSIAGMYPLTVAQLTVLTTMVLVAHTFPIELQVSKKAGVRFFTMFLLRFGFGLILGIILNLIYSSFGILQEKAVIAWSPSFGGEQTLAVWALTELKKYGMVCVMIISLVTLMEILKLIGFIDWLERRLEPIVGRIGLSKDVVPLSVIGLALGIAYGGALIINESVEKKIDKRQIFYAMTLMGLCHSMIEDTLLMLAVGGHYSGVIIARIVFAFIMTWLIVRYTRNLSDEVFEKYLVVPSIRSKN